MSDAPGATRSENSFGSRVRRYAQVGGAVAGQAAKAAGRRVMGTSEGRIVPAAELRRVLGGLKGPLMKVAQMLATIPDAIPKEYAAELAQLQSEAPPMGPAFVNRRMRAELGPDWRARFDDFDMEAAAAASLGQVHRASAGGRRLALKLQYPAIEAAVEADLEQLKVLFALYQRFDPAIDPARIYEEIAARLREELDYAREAKHMALYSKMLEGVPNVHVPETIPDLSTGRLLAMGWLDGAKLANFEEADQESRDRLAMNMFHAWYKPFYDYGVIHGDPHLGNYTVRDDLDVNLLDFGCVRIFPPSFVQGVIELYHAIDQDNEERARHAYELWGFVDLRPELLDVLNEWARFLYAPLMDNRKRRIQETNSGVYGRDVVERVHVRLREVGGVQPPREFVFMDRAAIGLGSVFLRLEAEINWHELFHGLIGGFDVDEMAKKQKEALEAVGLDRPQ